jgi:hypothetical protein
MPLLWLQKGVWDKKCNLGSSSNTLHSQQFGTTHNTNRIAFSLKEKLQGTTAAASTTKDMKYSRLQHHWSTLHNKKNQWHGANNLMVQQSSDWQINNITSPAKIHQPRRTSISCTHNNRYIPLHARTFKIVLQKSISQVRERERDIYKADGKICFRWATLTHCLTTPRGRCMVPPCTLTCWGIKSQIETWWSERDAGWCAG